MSRRDQLIPLYAADIREKFGQEPDMELLRAVAIGLGPAIYNHDSDSLIGCNIKGTSIPFNSCLRLEK